MVLKHNLIDYSVYLLPAISPIFVRKSISTSKDLIIVYENEKIATFF